MHIMGQSTSADARGLHNHHIHDQKLELKDLLHRYSLHGNGAHFSEAQYIAINWLICGYLRPAKPLTPSPVGTKD